MADDRWDEEASSPYHRQRKITTVARRLARALPARVRLRALDQSTLITAIHDGRTQRVAQMVKWYDLEKSDRNGVTPIIAVAMTGRVRILQLLVAAGARVNSSRPCDGATGLSIAAQLGSVEMCRAFLEAGATVECALTSDGSTPLFLAACFGHTHAMTLLLAHGAEVDMRTTTNGTSPLFMAAQQGFEGCVVALLEHGANIDIQKHNGASSLYIAAEKGRTHVASLLINHNANANLAKNTGATPLFIAATKGHARVASILLAAGARADLGRHTDSATPLMVAAEKGLTHIVSDIIITNPHCLEQALQREIASVFQWPSSAIPGLRFLWRHMHDHDGLASTISSCLISSGALHSLIHKLRRDKQEVEVVQAGLNLLTSLQQDPQVRQILQQEHVLWDVVRPILARDHNHRTTVACALDLMWGLTGNIN